MHETENKTTLLKKRLIGYLWDPVLIYTVIAMTSIMYHYRDTMLTAVYSFASLVIGILIFRLFDFMMKHKVIGAAAYILLFYVFIQAAVLCMDYGEKDYPISFGIWFITPQAAVDFNKWYTFGIFLLFMFFMSSVIYYFTCVRYRIFMGFLIFIIPFAIYGKEAEQMPIVFIILMAVGYIMLLVYFRHLRDSDTVVVAAKKETWRAAGIYALLFAAAAALVPKPKVQADRTFIESLISAERFTDRLVGMLGILRDSSSGGQNRDVDNNTPLYYVAADEVLHFKLATFSTYDYIYDSWYAEDEDKEELDDYNAAPIDLGRAGDLTQAILTAAELDYEFAQEYGLSGYVPEEIVVPEERLAAIYSVYSGTELAPVPQFAKSLVWTNAGVTMKKMKTGLIRSRKRFPVSSAFEYRYYGDTFFTEGRNKEIVDIISRSDYSELLWDAFSVLHYADGDFSQYEDILRDEYLEYTDYCVSLLDYGGNERIYDLAQEITQGVDSDYDKAKAIEQYFFANDFVYDLKYVKSRSENAESFLFSTKRGVCYEYATSMVLLARAAGIPARYCEGYLVSELRDNSELDTDYVVTPNDAHGYPELYIEGFGWTVFEPTIAAAEGENEEKSLSEMLMIAGAMLFGLLVLIFVSIKIYPLLSHKFFIARCRRRTPNEAVKAVMYRLCRIYRISGVNTSHEAAEKITEISGANILVPADLFDAAVYGDAVLDNQEKERVLDAYISAYEAYRDIKKKRRITTA